MPSTHPLFLMMALNPQASSLTRRLEALHDKLLETVPSVDRIACALYDANEDLLKTFINSTRAGKAIAGYEYKLSASQALSALAASGEFRVLDNIEQALQSDTGHTTWLREQGYRSSFTVPIFDGGSLTGFVFFDSMRATAFTAQVQRDLVLYTNLISMAIANELSAVRSVLDATRVARELTEVRDFETGSHLERMARYSRVVAQAVAPGRGLNDEFIESVYLFSSLHDIGKMGIPDSVLLKPGKLDAAERAIMETHVDIGVRIIERIVGAATLRHLPDSLILRNIIHCHHEYLDGSGYPRHLKGDDIPLEARIVTVADIFDALTAARPYKRVWTPTQALDELDRMAEAGQLDRDCVAVVHSHLDQLLAIHNRYQDEKPDAATGM
ncbi:MAG: HD domain-containing phosphohydrolase [Hydrogenophaga sp.]|nr:HD domain-containing phosphohydrolase [Hydrogenophaga sp.]